MPSISNLLVIRSEVQLDIARSCKTLKKNYRYVGSVLTYNPTTPVLREMPFDIPMQCKYPRLFHSYKVGFYPKLQGALGFDVTGAQSFNLAKNMITSNSWTIDLSDKDGHDKIYPRMKFSDADVLVDDFNKAEHTDFLQNWGED
ncbi:hypothetical protein FQN60_012340 [Etheostoma spectabile]|uniref:ZP domain-containing protein n=1 Tax=Etheostoma spectabile TaxID=54343 RepID=A0A5J5DPC1_9PERO|nr:hypothetical protein FQN60_012340 [Etheostoma spectabile]